MNARRKGHEAGFASILSFRSIKKSAFEKIGQAASKRAYKQASKQQEFFAGWMENWSDEPFPPATPETEILTF
ncbi:MAG TPA: hypothetical protein VFA10_18015 [Ktedonobacteraceae bacterium]|nr:hypothetical protein [Ktedonobacteraceae bacterium]